MGLLDQPTAEVDKDWNLSLSHGEEAVYQIQGSALKMIIDEVKRLTQDELILIARLKHLREMVDCLYYEHDPDHQNFPFECIRCRGLMSYEQMLKDLEL